MLIDVILKILKIYSHLQGRRVFFGEASSTSFWTTSRIFHAPPHTLRRMLGSYFFVPMLIGH
jgi:hypothetical protein